MKSKYPFVLVHGVALKDFLLFKAFGRIEKMLEDEGYRVRTAKTDAFGTIENNAAQLKEDIQAFLRKTGAEKVNIIAHSKGGLDARYMIEHLGMEDAVASLTTLCTPHRGAALASRILHLPGFVLRILDCLINLVYRIGGDKRPAALAVCRQLQAVPEDKTVVLHVSDKVYCQSYSAVLEKKRLDFVMDVPLMYFKTFENGPSDGMVSVESAKYGNYRGECMEESVSHSEIVDFGTKKKKNEKVFLFYKRLCAELAEDGF